MPYFACMRKASLFLMVLLGCISLAAFRKGNGTLKTAKKHPTFLMVSDAHVDTKSKSSEYGGDTGMDLWHAFLRKMDEILSGPHAPEFIVYTGDLPAHYKCGGTCHLAPADRAQHNADIDTALTDLDRLAKKHHKPLFYVPGNNDALAGDYYSFADEAKQTPLSLVHTSGYFFPQEGEIKTGAAPQMASDPEPGMGYYAAYPVKNLRLIVLNTVIFHQAFTPVDHTSQQADGDKEIKWLAEQLADAAAKNEQVYLAMHIPPGMDPLHNRPMWAHLPKGRKDDWQDEFLNLVSRYSTTIAAILYGHTHMDEVRRLYDSTGRTVTAVAISGPGVTPQHYNNPAFRLVDYDAESKQPLSFTTYYTSPDAVAWGKNSYTFSDAYGGKGGISIYDRLRSMPLDTLANRMNRIYLVKHYLPLPFNTANGIEVKRGQ
jgi:sphingomyelin phosphodiesterase acid-like 3